MLVSGDCGDSGSIGGLHSVCFFCNDTAPTEIYTLSLHDALPISSTTCSTSAVVNPRSPLKRVSMRRITRSEEHTSELQSHHDLVCRLLLEKKNNKLHFQPQLHTVADIDARQFYDLLLNHFDHCWC